MSRVQLGNGEVRAQHPLAGSLPAACSSLHPWLPGAGPCRDGAPSFCAELSEGSEAY